MKLSLTALFIFIAFTSAFSQDLKEKRLFHLHKNTYQYGQEIIKFNDLRNIFEQDEKAFKYYNNAKFGNGLGIILGTISISYMAQAIPNFGSDHDFAAVGILVTIAYA